MTPLAILQEVITIAEFVYEQAQLVESNKARWKNLTGLIDTVVSSLRGLSKLPEQDNFLKGLTQLKAQLEEASQFLDKMCTMPYWKRFFNAGKHQAKIDGFRADILELIPVLSLGLNAQQLIDREQDRQSEKADREAFMKAQQQQLHDRQAAHLKQRCDIEEVMRKQMHFFNVQLERNWKPAAVKQDVSPLPEQFMIQPFEVTFKQKISDSRLGNIYRGEWNGQDVLVKWIEGPIMPADQQQFIREAQIMSHLRHNNIVPFYGACFDEEQMCIVTGVVEQLLSDCLSTLDLISRLKMAHHLAQGLKYLHQQGVVHTDIAPLNIGVTKHQEAKWMDLSWVKTNVTALASKGIAHEATLWQAPETWSRRDCLTQQSDVYSFAWLLWSLYTGREPFSNHNDLEEVCRRIQQGEREVLPDDCPTEIAELIRQGWDADPSCRPSLTDFIDTLGGSFLFQQTRAPSPSGETYYKQGKAAYQEGDLVTAFTCFSRSAEKNYSKSYNSLGFFALEGKGGERKDPEKARKYFEQGANVGNATAMGNLARLYEKGYIGGRVNLTTALSWYEKAKQTEPSEARYQNKVETITKSLTSSKS